MKTLCCMHSYISPMHTSRTSSFIKIRPQLKHRNTVKGTFITHNQRCFYPSFLFQTVTCCSCIVKSKTSLNIEVLFTQKLLISYSGTSQSPLIFTILKKKMGSVNFAASLHLFFITPKVQITVGLHWQSTTPQ